MAHVCIGPSRPCVLTVLEYIQIEIHGFTTCLHAPITFGPFMVPPQRVRGDVSSVDRDVATSGFSIHARGVRVRVR